MDNNIKAILEASPSAMLLVRDGRILHANSLASQIPGCREGESAASILPDHILSGSGSFTASAVIGGKAWSVRVEDTGDMRCIALQSRRDRADVPEILSDNLMSGMLSTVFNIGLATDRLASLIGSGGGKEEPYLSLLSHNYYRMRHALSNLSTAMALRKGSLPFSFRATDLCSLCSELCATVSIMCRSRGLSIEFSTHLGELYAWVDSEKIERILLNLISNSLLHTPAGGRLSLGLEKRGSNAYISVDDTGCGIPPRVMAELFSAYERELELKEMAESGGGLGLGIARGLAEAHDGALIIESQEAKGTSVRVMLPLKTENFNVLEAPRPPYLNSGMSMILTELSAVLDPDCYGKRFRD